MVAYACCDWLFMHFGLKKITDNAKTAHPFPFQWVRRRVLCLSILTCTSRVGGEYKTNQWSYLKREPQLSSAPPADAPRQGNISFTCSPEDFQIYAFALDPRMMDSTLKSFKGRISVSCSTLGSLDMSPTGFTKPEIFGSSYLWCRS